MAKKIKYPVLVSVTPVFGVFFFLGAGGAQPSGPHLGPRSPPVPIQAHFVPFIGTGSTEQPGRGLYESWFSLFSRWEGDGNRKKKIYIYFFFFMLSYFLDTSSGERQERAPKGPWWCSVAAFPTPECVPRLSEPRSCLPFSPRRLRAPRGRAALRTRGAASPCPPHPSQPSRREGRASPSPSATSCWRTLLKRVLENKTDSPPPKKILKKQNPKFCAIYNRRVLDPTDCAGKGRRGKGVGFSLMNS